MLAAPGQLGPKINVPEGIYQGANLRLRNGPWVLPVFHVGAHIQGVSFAQGYPSIEQSQRPVRQQQQIGQVFLGSALSKKPDWL